MENKILNGNTKNSPPLFTYERLLQAYLACRKNKGNKETALEFNWDFERELFRLEREFQTKTYSPSPAKVFVITDPKIREIFASPFHDRVVHHLLYNFLNPIFNPRFIYDSYACRLNKGMHKAVKRLQYFLRTYRLKEKLNPIPYFLQIDIKSFFNSIDQKILFRIVKTKLIKEAKRKNPLCKPFEALSDWLWLIQKIIFYPYNKKPQLIGQMSLFFQVPKHKSFIHAPPGKGLPIGNLTSQFFANVYLDRLDQFVKHKLKVRHYIRYMDDLIIIHLDLKKLNYYLEEIRAFLKKRLELEIHPRKIRINTVERGIDFLGYFVRPHCVYVRRRVVGNFKWKIANWDKLENPEATLASYMGHLKYANSFRLRTSIKKKIPPEFWRDKNF